MEANLELSATVEVPRQCPSLRDEPCRGTAFEQLQSQLHTELQDIRLRQGSQAAQEASAPQGTTAILLGQLVGSCHPGGESLPWWLTTLLMELRWRHGVLRRCLVRPDGADGARWCRSSGRVEQDLP